MAAVFNAADFTGAALADIGKTITYYAPTIVNDNETGKQNVTLTGGSSITGIFLRREQLYKLDKSGFIEQGDAFIIHATSVTLAKDGEVVVESRRYRIDNTITRYAGSTAMYNFTRLYLVGV